ncbi:MAG: hypothetical protein LC641_06450 [Spirochaeta sp.]|nr:hypothetical protein [Spirochaeta sp.]
MPLSILVLHRGGRIDREGLFRDLSERHDGEIISIEAAEGSYDVERLAQRYGNVKFILPARSMNIGAQINVGMSECSSEYLYVIWNDMRLHEISERMLSRVMSEDVLCNAPYIRNDRSLVIPTVMTPAFERRGNLRVLPQTPHSETVVSLYPYDYVGIYRKQRYLDVFGYDSRINRPYWQKLEFGLRCWMWNEQIHLSSALRIAYSGSPPSEDATPDEDYLRFYWKTLGVRISLSGADLSSRRLIGGIVRTPTGAPTLIRSFRELRRELRRYGPRYKRSALKVISEWEADV